MADSRGFISFDFDHDETSRNLFAGQAKKASPTPFAVQDWSSKSSLPAAEWETILKAKIATCDLMIVLVGRSMASAAGVAKEIAFARAANVPFFGVYIDGADTTSTLPSGLARNRTISWNWDNIATAIDQMLTEGKHKG